MRTPWVLEGSGEAVDPKCERSDSAHEPARKAHSILPHEPTVCHSRGKHPIRSRLNKTDPPWRTEWGLVLSVPSTIFIGQPARSQHQQYSTSGVSSGACVSGLVIRPFSRHQRKIVQQLQTDGAGSTPPPRQIAIRCGGGALRVRNIVLRSQGSLNGTATLGRKQTVNHHLPNCSQKIRPYEERGRNIRDHTHYDTNHHNGYGSKNPAHIASRQSHDSQHEQGR